MKIIHTSDWHIGRRFERESLVEEQQNFLDWLAATVEEHQVDLIIVAGDIYDRSQPAEDAVTLLDQGLNGLRAAGATVALISGNHDNTHRLGFGARRQALGGVYFFADDQHAPTPWVFATGDERVALVAVPFLDPYAVPTPRPATDGSPRARTHQNVLVDALEHGRNQLTLLDPMLSIAVVHAFVSGSEVSESEKALSIGGADKVDPSVLDGFDYVALGHLHRPQLISGRDAMAYSGSPLPYSFSEDHPKSVRLLELDGGGVSGVTTLPIPVGRPVVTLEDTLDNLLTDPDYDRYLDHWVAARLTDDTVQTQPMERLRKRFPHIVNLRYANARTGAVADLGDDNGSIEDRPREEVIFEFLEELRDRPQTESERDLVLTALAKAERQADA